MRWRKFYIILFSAVTLVAFGQERQMLTGIVVSDGDEFGLSEVFVINLNAGIETKTDESGTFLIAAQSGDTLTIYSNYIEVRKFNISEQAWKETPFKFSVAFKSIELEEVVVDRKITSETLGIVPKGQRRYTPAERKLRTASKMTPEILANNVLVHGQDVGKVIGVGVPTDAIINSLNGKTRQLKKELEVEKKEQLREESMLLYTQEEIIRNLKIPHDYVDGFYYFLIENNSFLVAMESDNDSAVKLVMAELAAIYLSNISESPVD